MQQQTVRRIVRVTVIIGLGLQAATIAIAAFTWSGRTSGAFIAGAASVVMVVTLALQATFVGVQSLPSGRVHVPIFTATDDGWTLVIISTMLPGVLWNSLGVLAGPPMSQLMPGFATPLLTCLLLLIGRQVQLRRVTAAHTQERPGQSPRR